MVRCCIGLGGNLGDVRDTCRRALQQFAALGVAVADVSRLYRTAAVGTAAGSPFLNACAVVETAHCARELLDVLHTVEDRCGRTRAGRWTARTLDLDLLLCGEQVIQQPELRLPHPGIVWRRFVLDPLADVAAEWVHPLYARTVASLRARLLQRPLAIVLAGAAAQQQCGVRERLQARFGDVISVEFVEDHRAALMADPTIILLDAEISSPAAAGPMGAAPERVVASRPAPDVSGDLPPVAVRPDPLLASRDLAGAVEALVSGMLDEPICLGRFA